MSQEESKPSDKEEDAITRQIETWTPESVMAKLEEDFQRRGFVEVNRNQFPAILRRRESREIQGDLPGYKPAKKEPCASRAAIARRRSRQRGKFAEGAVSKSLEDTP